MLLYDFNVGSVDQLEIWIINRIDLVSGELFPIWVLLLRLYLQYVGIPTIRGVVDVAIISHVY
jgi:hypothetical protein